MSRQYFADVLFEVCYIYFLAQENLSKVVNK